jgi:hypothetical protein
MGHSARGRGWALCEWALWVAVEVLKMIHATKQIAIRRKQTTKGAVMKMPSKIAMMILAAVPLVISGCSMHPSYNGLYARKDATSTGYQAASFTVLGPVTATGHAKGVLGITVEAHEGEGLLWDAARSKYGDKVTGIKDITSFGDYESVLGFIYWKLDTTYTGVAVYEK